MEEKAKNINLQWEISLYQKQLNLVLDDIQAAKKSLANKRTENEELSKQLEDLEFHFDELQMEAKSLEDERENLNISQDCQSTENDEENNFFSYLTYLENEETSYKEELEMNKKMIKELMHEKNIISQKNNSIKHKFHFQRNQMAQEKENNALLQGELNDRKNLLDTKENEMLELSSACDKMEEEAQKRTKEMKINNETIIKELREQKKELQEQLDKKQKEYEHIQNKIKKTEMETQGTIDDKKAYLRKIESTKSWENDRAIQIGKLKKAKEQLSVQQRSLLCAQKKEEDLRRKFQELLNQDDPGDGTGLLAKQIVIAEINSLQANTSSEIDKELELERQYNEQLNKQLQLIENSIKIFEEHKKDILSFLKEEFIECKQEGYLDLLTSEKSELQTL